MPFRFRLRNPAAVASPPLRDSICIRLDDGRDIDILRVRDPRARRIKLSINERGARLTLPMRASLIAGDRFVHAHRGWLAAQLSRIDDDAVAPLVRDVTAALPLRGESVPLSWAQGRFTAVDLDETGIRFHAAARAGDAALRRALRDFYEAQARADIGRWLPNYLPSLPRAPRRVQFKVMSSQWGSLAPDGSVALDLSLVLAPPSAFEYVLVHELCHLIHHDHSPRFWCEVETRCPDWRLQRDYFHGHGRKLKAQLRALIAAPTR